MKRFPILDGGMSIPWTMIEPYELQAKANHGQSLKQLAGRGGLDPSEALAVLDGQSWRQFTARNMSEAEARKELDARRERFERAALGDSVATLSGFVLTEAEKNALAHQDIPVDSALRLKLLALDARLARILKEQR